MKINSLEQYKQQFESQLEELWNDSARFKFLNYEEFCGAMYRSRQEAITQIFSHGFNSESMEC
jgi:hypothetical protein